jgi:hypothetical protein
VKNLAIVTNDHGLRHFVRSCLCSHR